MEANGKGSLHIVSTPIGNLGDITYRSVETLKQMDLVAAEDTRRTRILFHHYGITTPLTSFNTHNQARRGPDLVRMMREGKNVALVSDAGTPGISDPLFFLVRLAIDNEIPVTPLPGPSAALAALTVSGLPIDRFFFEGFLPRKKRRATTLRQLAALPGAVVLFESPMRIERTLKDLLEFFGNRPAALTRELTKLHEEILRGTLEDLIRETAGRKWKGEITLIIAGHTAATKERMN